MGSSIFKINLNSIKFYSRIGVFGQERIVGNEFELDIAIEYDGSMFEMENLSSSISYADVYGIVKVEMDKEWLLLESVAQQIATKIIGAWECVEKISVKINKMAPPVAGITGKCGVEYFWKKY